MKVIEMLRQYWERLQELLVYARYCAGSDMKTAECRDFWLWMVYAAIGVGLLIAFIIGRRAVKEHLEFRRNRRRLEAQRIAVNVDEWVPEVVNVGPAADPDLSQEELAAKIGQALKARALDSASAASKEHTDGKPNAAPQRELAAIMLTDMVGYAESMERDEEGTYAKLLEHNVIVRAAMADHRGREVKTIGDSFLVIFRSAVDAVECAISIQQALDECNQAKNDDDKTFIRIGVHLGEVMVTANDVFGDGVNIAARIEPLADPGGICVSGEVFAVVHKKIDFKLERLEGVQLKNIAIAPDIYRVRLN